MTEKAYCHHPATGRLDENHPDIVHDLASHPREQDLTVVTRVLEQQGGTP